MNVSYKWNCAICGPVSLASSIQLLWVLWSSSFSPLSLVLSSPSPSSRFCSPYFEEDLLSSLPKVSLRNPAFACGSPCINTRSSNDSEKFPLSSWKCLGFCYLKAGLPVDCSQHFRQLRSSLSAASHSPLHVMRCRELSKRIYTAFYIMGQNPQPYEIFLFPNSSLIFEQVRGIFLNCIL